MIRVPRPGRALDLERAAERGGPAAHVGEAVVAGSTIDGRSAGSKPIAVVGDRERRRRRHRVATLTACTCAALRVARHVAERLADDLDELVPRTSGASSAQGGRQVDLDRERGCS